MKWVSKPLPGTPLNWAHPLNKGLVGFWLMNEGMGYKLNDLSNNRNTGTLTGMAFPPTAASGWNPSRKGIGLQFDGSNDIVTVGDAASLNITNAITISAWIYLNSIPTANKAIVAKTTGATSAYRIYIEYSAPNIGFKFQFFGLTDTYLSGTPRILSANTWYYLVAVYDGAYLRSYVNGTPDLVDDSSGSISTNSNNLLIGNDATWFFPGKIDEVRIWNRALSAKEILQLYVEPYGMFL